jgi:hypothetical protein
MIARARTVVRRWHGSYEQECDDPLSRPYRSRADAQAVRIHDHLKVCSGTWCGCGNPRRSRGAYSPVLTRQERLADLDMREQLSEVALVAGDFDVR